MSVDFDERRKSRRKRVERLERRVRELRRNQSRRERRKALRPWKNALLLIALGIAAWFLVPALFGADSVSDAAAQARETALEEIEEAQDSLIEDVSDVIGVEIEPIEETIDLEGAVIDGWAAPLDMIDPERATRPHHTYAAWDYGTRVGTPIYAMTSGFIAAAEADDGARCGGIVSLTTEAERANITYCHLSEVFVARGDQVEAGELIGLTGGKPGDRGAGRSSGPHLHLQIRLNGELHCPQAQLVALNVGEALDVGDLPTSGCSYNSNRFSASPGDDDAFAPPGNIDEEDPLFVWDP